MNHSELDQTPVVTNPTTEGFNTIMKPLEEVLAELNAGDDEIIENEGGNIGSGASWLSNHVQSLKKERTKLVKQKQEKILNHSSNIEQNEKILLPIDKILNKPLIT